MSADAVNKAMGQWALPCFVALAIACLGVAFFMDERRGDSDFVRRLRGRAKYLRWLSMSCLAIMGAIVAAGVREAAPDHVGPIAVLGLVAAVLAAVYRYVVRLAYFYESRADVIEVSNMTAWKLVTEHAESCEKLTALLAPDAVEYRETHESMKKVFDSWLKAKTKE